MSVVPTLMHAIGDGQLAEGEWGIVRLTPAKGLIYRYVSCAYPREFLEALRWTVGPQTWVETTDGTMLQLAHVVEAEIVPRTDG